jgi:hypothetical protein
LGLQLMLLFGMVARDEKEQYLAFENIDGLVKAQDASLKLSKVTKCGGGRYSVRWVVSGN